MPNSIFDKHLRDESMIWFLSATLSITFDLPVDNQKHTDVQANTFTGNHTYLPEFYDSS